MAATYSQVIVALVGAFPNTNRYKHIAIGNFADLVTSYASAMSQGFLGQLKASMMVNIEGRKWWLLMTVTPLYNPIKKPLVS